MALMTKRMRDWPCLAFARLNIDEHREFAGFILWLFDWGLRDDDDLTVIDPRTPLDPDAQLEVMWSTDNAPRKRTGKLLWQLLVYNDCPDLFHQQFTLSDESITKQITASTSILDPIQQKLHAVLDGFIARQAADATIGQGNWGEAWWLPREQAEYVPEQLARARPSLIEETSSYQDAMEWAMVPYLELATDDPHRAYTGAHCDNGRTVVIIEDREGKRWPLSHAHFPFQEMPGTGFTWGYGGHGPSELATSIIADTTDGDLQLADRLRDDFVNEVLSLIPIDQPLRLTRIEVIAWMDAKGIGAQILAEAGARVAALAKQRSCDHGTQAPPCSRARDRRTARPALRYCAARF